MDRYPLVSALVPPADRQAPGGRRPDPRRPDGEPRLHGQGQRPGALRGRRGLRWRPSSRSSRRSATTPGPARRPSSTPWTTTCPIDVTKKSPYSIDQNVWGRAVETGFLEDIWNAPIEDVYNYTADPSVPREPDEVVITFVGGVPTAIDGVPVTMLEAIEQLNARAGAQGVGRLDIVEDRLVGIKSREVYEAPGAIALITAHQELESVTVERDLARFKRTVDQRWGELVYDGLWFSPLKRALDAFIASSQQAVTGDIRMTLHAGRAVPTGRRSPTSLYDFNLATYDAGDSFDQSLAKGFVELWGLPSKHRGAAGTGRAEAARA